MIAEQILRDIAATDRAIFEAVIMADMEDCYKESVLTEEQKLLMGDVADPKNNLTFIEKIKLFVEKFIEKMKDFFAHATENLEKIFATAKGNAEIFLKYNKFLDWVKREVFVEIPDYDVAGLKIPCKYDINPDAIIDMYDKLSMKVNRCDDNEVQELRDEWLDNDSLLIDMLDETISHNVVDVGQYKKTILAQSFIDFDKCDKIDKVVIHEDELSAIMRRIFGDNMPKFGYRVKSNDIKALSQYAIDGGKYAIEFKYKKKQAIDNLNRMHENVKKLNSEASRTQLNTQYNLVSIASRATTIAYSVIIAVIKEIVMCSKAILNKCLISPPYVIAKQKDGKRHNDGPKSKHEEVLFGIGTENFVNESTYELDMSELY